MLRTLMLTGAAFVTVAGGPAFAQQAAPATAAATVAPTAGAKVFDAQGGEVGTIESVSGTTAVVNTGTNKAAVPFTSFAARPNGLVLGMTRTELDAAASAAGADAKAAFAAKLVAGAAVLDKAGTQLGTIDANDGTLVTLALGTTKVKLPVAAFGPSTTGTGVQIGMTAAELDAAAKQAGASADQATAPDTATADASTKPAPQK